MKATLAERVVGSVTMRQPKVMVVNGSQLMIAQSDISIHLRRPDDKKLDAYHLTVKLTKSVDHKTLTVQERFIIERYKTANRYDYFTKGEQYTSEKLLGENDFVTLTKHQLDTIIKYLRGFFPVSSSRLVSDYRQINRL